MRKILFLVIMACVALSFVACGSSGNSEKKTEEELFNQDYDLYEQFEGDEYTECSDMIGKTVWEMKKEGYKFRGYINIGEQWCFYFTDDNYDYSMILDDSAEEIMEKLDSDATAGKTLLMLMDCVIEKCYSKESGLPSSSEFNIDDLDALKYTIRSVMYF